jgi:hypothetical protein
MNTFPIIASRVRAGSLVVAALLAAGCAATVQRGDASSPSAQAAAQPSMKIPAAAHANIVLSLQLEPPHPKDSGWTSFRQEWIDIAKERVAANGIAFSAQDGDPKPTGAPGTLVVVRVKDYKHVGTGARVMLGVMTGNAFIDAKVEFRDLANGNLYGERSFNTTSSAWEGIFASTTPKQIYALADEIIGEIRRP